MEDFLNFLNVNFDLATWLAEVGDNPIRAMGTFIVKGGRAYFQVGGGIVADSDPEMEYQETLDKARALIDALGCKQEESISI